jgi:hypothetical protein
LALYGLFVHVLGKGHLKNDSRDFKHLEPFKRIDVKNWSLLKQLPLVLTVIPRVLLACGNLFFYMVWVMVFMLGVKDKVSPFRSQMIKGMGFICCRF